MSQRITPVTEYLEYYSNVSTTALSFLNGQSRTKLSNSASKMKLGVGTSAQRPVQTPEGELQK